MKFEIVKADITKLKVDAIVNAANSAMSGGGAELLAECRTIGRCEAGDAKITQGYNLPAKHIIHTVGSVWYGGHKNEEYLLASCYKRCIQIAEEYNIKSLAFPAISCGAYRFPIDKACNIAISEIMKTKKSSIQKIIFVCFENKIETALKRSLKNHE